MSLFGLINVVFGLGALTKDWLVETYKEPERIKKAEENGSYFYLSGSKIKSTKTGRTCSTRRDYNTYHEILVDSRTGEFIEDLTVRQNTRKTNEAREEARAKGWKFYATHMFDDFKHTCHGIYVNDNLPGKYFCMYNGIKTINGKSVVIFGEAELVDGICGGKKTDVIFGGNRYDQYGNYIPKGTRY